MPETAQPEGAQAPEARVPVEQELPPPRTPRVRLVRWAAIAVALAGIALGVVFGSRFGTDPSLVKSPLLGKTAPTFELPYLEKEGTLSLDSQRGQIVVVNFWASWCVACRAEHDDLVRTALAYEDQGVRFVGIVFQDKPEEAIRFLDEMGRGYDNVTDDGSRVAIEYGVYGIPETFFIDPNGVVTAKIVGESNVALLSSTLDTILRGEIPESSMGGYLQAPPEK